MANIDKAVSKLEGACKLIEFIHLRYPEVLKEWSNGSARATTNTDAEKAISSERPIRNDYNK